MAIWYIFPRFGFLYQEKSGNPGLIQFLANILTKRIKTSYQHLLLILGIFLLYQHNFCLT
jgi:hypothetical protein